VTGCSFTPRPVGVGQAAVAIARAAGAEIFATAGSPRRRELLHHMGIDHVYNSAAPTSPN